MGSIKLKFMLAVLNFIGDWYSIYKPGTEPNRDRTAMQNIEMLKRTVRETYDGEESQMTKMRLFFIMIVLDFISDWYSINRIPRSRMQVQKTFEMINEMRGSILDRIESDDKTTI